LTETVVISGAAPVATGNGPPVPLLSVPEVVDLATADEGQGVQLVIQNPTGRSLTAAVDGTGDVTIARADRAVVPFRAAPEGDRLLLQIRADAEPRVVTVIVSVEATDDGPVAVAQAIGAHVR
jgi:hypothetical protein